NPVYRKGEKFILLYTGTFVAVQNLELLYRTMVELKNENVELILIGGMKRELEVERIKIEKLGIGSRILLYPRMAQDDLRPYYEQAHLVVSPREFGHDTPMKIFDYLNYGKCILATRRPIHADILDDDNSILAEPDALSFAAAIRNLMNKPGNIAQKGERAKKYFNDNLDFKYMLQKYKDLFDSLESNG
ncbi:MAG: glycosyltransferase family 4 protein, partial [Candidatus Cloacimonetes bacterium]|nr:glycosyltransferase family 4 protein [Candidatus Cloacimonadota bacterium]